MIFVLAMAVSGYCQAADRVFLLAGQSNMVGQGVAAELTGPLSRPQPDVHFWSNGWVPLAPGYGRESHNFGPEVSFGRTIKDALPGNDIYLVKYGSNGKALYNDFKPYTGPNYIEMIKTFNAALANLNAAGVEYTVAGMLWMQGESDAYEAQAAAYETNLLNFVDVIRTEFNTPAMPFIIARVLDHFGGTVPPKIGEQTIPSQAHIVRTAQVSVAENTPYATWFDTDGYEIVDPVDNPGHYGTQGQVDLGNDFASAILEFPRD